METLRYYNLHPPDDVRIWDTPRDAIRRCDDVAKVYNVQIESGLILRHYAFFHHWFEVNCTLSPSGALVAEDGPIPWCFNCDIATPSVLIDGDEYNVDLFLDVLVGPDVRTFAIVDEDEFDQAIANEWVTDREQAGARIGLEELLGLIRSGRFVSFLEQICPFTDVATADVPLALPMISRHLRDVPLLASIRRERGGRQR